MDKHQKVLWENCSTILWRLLSRMSIEQVVIALWCPPFFTLSTENKKKEFAWWCSNTIIWVHLFMRDAPHMKSMSWCFRDRLWLKLSFSEWIIQCNISQSFFINKKPFLYCPFNSSYHNSNKCYLFGGKSSYTALLDRVLFPLGSFLTIKNVELKTHSWQ